MLFAGNCRFQSVQSDNFQAVDGKRHQQNTNYGKHQANRIKVNGLNHLEVTI